MQTPSSSKPHYWFRYHPEIEEGPWFLYRWGELLPILARTPGEAIRLAQIRYPTYPRTA